MTNYERIAGTVEKVTNLLADDFSNCPPYEYCNHWIEEECVVNPNWDCKNAIIKYLKSESKVK